MLIVQENVFLISVSLHNEKYWSKPNTTHKTLILKACVFYMIKNLNLNNGQPAQLVPNW